MRAKQRQEERLKQLAQVFYTLPADVKRKVSENVAEYLISENRGEQLSLLFGEDVVASSPQAESYPRHRSLNHSRDRRKRKIAFGWYGGKFNHLNWLLPLLPYTHHYCEPFGGSAAVLLNRQPSPVETYNDIDGEVVNFFRVLRDQTDELMKTIALTPFSRKEFALAVSRPAKDLPDLERARLIFKGSMSPIEHPESAAILLSQNRGGLCSLLRLRKDPWMPLG
jgi:hypothetical protein